MDGIMPQYIHLPLQFLWFDSEELMLIIVIYLSMMIFGIYAGVVGIACLLYYMRLKRNKPRGYLGHLMYSIGLYKIKGCSNPFANRFYE